MIPHPSAVSNGLTWTLLPKNRGYEIHQQGEVIGMLLNPDPASSDFRAESGLEKWIFRRSGLVGASAQILEMETRRPVATFRSSWRMLGMLTFADGTVFHLQCKGVWHPVWSIANEDGETVLTLHAQERIVENRNVTHISEERRMLLTMFAIYRVLQAEEDAASAAIVAMCS
jgi:hypothetical protein